MELLPLLCLCLLTRSGVTSAHLNGPPLIVVEGSDVVLPCSLSTKENIEFKLFDWRKVAQKDDGLKEVFMYDGGIHYNNGLDGQSVKFKGRVSHFQDELKYGNASIIIRNTTISDSGVYTCYFPRLQPPQTFYIELVVDPVLKDRSGENIPGAAPEPFVTTHHTNYGVLLQCKVHGSPKPRVEWLDSAGNILPAEEPQVSEREGRFYITLNATVTETDDYRCVATQETISHQISTRIYVNVSGSPTGWIVGLVLVALVVAPVLAVLVYKRCNPLKHNKDEEYEDVQNPSKSHGPANVPDPQTNIKDNPVTVQMQPQEKQSCGPANVQDPHPNIPLLSGPANVPDPQTNIKDNPVTVQMQPQEKPSCDPENQFSSTHTYEIPNHVRGQKQNPSCDEGLYENFNDENPSHDYDIV